MYACSKNTSTLALKILFRRSAHRTHSSSTGYICAISSVLAASTAVYKQQYRCISSSQDSSPSLAESARKQFEQFLKTANIPDLTRMNHIDVIRALLPVVQSELGSSSAFDLYASMRALARWQSANRSSKLLPGVPAMPNNKLDHRLISQTYQILRFATAAYGWKGMLFFYLTDRSASYGFGDIPSLLRTSALGDAASFSRLAGIPFEACIYESDPARVGMPKHFIVADENTKNIVLAIRGTMSLNDAFTDLVTRPIPFCNGEAHEGVAHGAHAIYAGTMDVLQAELKKRPGWGLVVTGHSLGAATAISFTILFHYYRDKQLTEYRRSKEDIPFYNVNIECHAFAPPPVFAPISVLPDHVQASIRSWINNEDIISRLSLDSVRDLVRILKKIGEHEPSLQRRIFSDVDVQEVLDTEPEWLRSWTGKDFHPERRPPSPPRANIGQHAEEELASSKPGENLKPSELVSGRRFHIPGILYCFRAPVDIGASAAIKDYSRKMGAPSREVVETDTDLTVAADPSVGGAAASQNPLNGVSNAISSSFRSVASFASSTVVGIGSTVASAAAGSLSTIRDTVASVLPSSIKTADPDADDVQLQPGVAVEAAARAQTESEPFVTIVRMEHMQSLPLTNRAWRDHVPDMYLNVFRQLKEVADRQAEAEESHDEAVTPVHGAITRHYKVTDSSYVSIDSESERVGASKTDPKALRHEVEEAEAPARKAIQQLEAQEKQQLGEDEEAPEPGAK